MSIDLNSLWRVWYRQMKSCGQHRNCSSLLECNLILRTTLYVALNISKKFNKTIEPCKGKLMLLIIWLNVYILSYSRLQIAFLLQTQRDLFLIANIPAHSSKYQCWQVETKVKKNLAIWGIYTCNTCSWVDFQWL